ncbi:hypothetical protein [Streptococcus halichoeri]|uniref:hypothetical protein n=1 Tax=Streptococcus halichoeri TaxID=254785 RepID=UPI00135807B3|nr:hypothetical protein [Streptococcus halichoeri]
MWLHDEQIEIVGVLTTISIGKDNLVFQAKFVVDDKYAKWDELSNDCTFTFKSSKQKSIDKIVAKVEKQYLELLKDKIGYDEILARISESLLLELNGFEERTKGYFEFHQLNYVSDIGEERVVWQSQYFDEIYVDRFFDNYD